MKLIALSINHETAPLSIREKVSFVGVEKISTATQSLQQNKLVKECAIISTCNRVEIYYISNDSDETLLIKWLENFCNVQQINNYIYVWRDLAAVQHLMRVACGLDSMVMGEPQILGQLKEAYNIAHQINSIHKSLENLFQYTFYVAKKIRTNTAIGQHPVSIASAAVVLAKQFFGNMNLQTSLLIGAGKTIQLVARHLKENNIGKMIIANRSLKNAHTLAEEVGGYAINLNEISKHLHEIDLVISSTSSTTPILMQSQIELAMQQHNKCPMFLIDLAVPRDIESSVQDINNTYLYTVDDLKDIVLDNKISRNEAATEAEEIILQQSKVFMNQFHATLQIKPIIKSYRSQAQILKKDSIAQAKKELATGKDAEQIIEKLATQLTNRLLHIPSEQLCKAAMVGNKQLIEYAKQLLFKEDFKEPVNKK